jgi:ubiquinone/menaquinone biosynthesis C-methylase UbiE
MNHTNDAVRDLFDAKAATWGAKYAKAGPLVERIETFRGVLAQVLEPPGRVLEFGCGTGNLAHALCERGYRVDACDISGPMITQAQEAFAADPIGWSLLPADWRRLPFDDATFDAVVASSVLEYVDDPGLVFREVARALRAGGTLHFTIPDVQKLERRIERALARLMRVRGVARVASVAPRAARYLQYLRLSKNRLTHAAWVAEARREGLVAVETNAHTPGRRPLMMISVRKSSPG